MIREECSECGNSPSVQIGDVFTVVIVHPNTGKDGKDPVAKVNGRTTFVRFPGKDDGHVEFGETVRVRLADKQPTYYLAVAIQDD